MNFHTTSEIEMTEAELRIKIGELLGYDVQVVADDDMEFTARREFIHAGTPFYRIYNAGSHELPNYLYVMKDAWILVNYMTVRGMSFLLVHDICENPDHWQAKFYHYLPEDPCKWDKQVSCFHPTRPETAIALAFYEYQTNTAVKLIG